MKSTITQIQAGGKRMSAAEDPQRSAAQSASARVISPSAQRWARYAESRLKLFGIVRS